MSTVGILVRPDLGKAGPAVRDLVAWLGERRVGACVDERTAALVEVANSVSCRVASIGEVAAGADVLVVLGGDGTLLAASHLVDRPVPVLGVNFGSLGFLTEITMPELYPTLEGVLRGEYRFEERRMLHARVQQRDTADTTGDVLNDVVVTKAALSRIIEFDVAIDGLFVSAFRADGLIVSSPTGSTAYALSCGGPIVEPSLDVFVVAPICPHTLSDRPIVVSSHSTIEFQLLERPDTRAQVTCDGAVIGEIEPGDRLQVRSARERITLLHPVGHDYYRLLRSKLHWGRGSFER